MKDQGMLGKFEYMRENVYREDGEESVDLLNEETFNRDKLVIEGGIREPS